MKMLKPLTEVFRLRYLRVFARLTMTLFLGPLLFYALARVTGDLPSHTAWFARGMNHGPWRWTTPGFFVAIPFLILIPLTIAVAVALGLIRHDRRYMVASSMLFGLQVSCLWGHLAWLFWTID